MIDECYGSLNSLGGGACGAGRKMSVESRLTAGKKKKSVMFASPGSAAPSEPPFTMDHV